MEGIGTVKESETLEEWKVACLAARRFEKRFHHMCAMIYDETLCPHTKQPEDVLWDILKEAKALAKRFYFD
jgi:hypothetical protein